jgi:hypothetical protein
MNLTTENMENVGGCGAINDLHVTILSNQPLRGLEEGGGYLMLTIDFIFRGEDTGVFVTEL